MVEILSIVRKEMAIHLKDKLYEKDIYFHFWHVKGRGKEGGLKYRGFLREKTAMVFLPKVAFSIFTDEEKKEEIINTIIETVHTGSYGDGKIFVFNKKEGTNMKMIKAIIRPEKLYDLISSLEKTGFKALTTWDVIGRGKEGGVQVGERSYNELVKTMVLIGVENDKDKDKVVDVITKVCNTGVYGDGKIFVCDISEVWTIRTKRREL